jgi:CubicO group peptidase (beta-lactamase class C family)
MKPGTVGTLRAVANEWAKSDPHPFVVLAARRGVVFMHEGYNGFAKTSGFYPASIAKSVAGLLFARAVDQGLLGFDATLASVFPNWGTPTTSQLTFRHCFYHALGLSGHYSHRGLYNTYLDQSLLIQDALFLEHTKRFVYGGDELNLTGAALALTTGTTVFRLLYEQLQRPFAEPVTQFDLGAGAEFTAMYLAKLGQMLMQDGAYGEHRFYQPGFVKRLWPEAISKYAPDFEDKAVESGIGLTWMIDPPGPREQGVLGPNVVGHGAASGVLWRIAADHDLVIVVGRNGFKNGADNQRFGSKLVEAVARGLDN